MSIMAPPAKLSIPLTIDSLPVEVQEVIEHAVARLGGSPTRETIEAICEQRIISSYAGRVLRYFLMESPLNLQDLRPLVNIVGARQAVVICQGTAQLRRDHELQDWKPRWPKDPS